MKQSDQNCEVGNTIKVMSKLNHLNTFCGKKELRTIKLGLSKLQQKEDELPIAKQRGKEG